VPTQTDPAGVPPGRHVQLPSGWNLFVREQGSGSPVVLLHGIPTSSLLWRKVMGPLSAAHRVLAVDMLGYGLSDKPSDVAPTLPTQVGLVAELAEQLGVTHAAVVGHDIGGGVAQLLCCSHPSLVSRLVLVDTIGYDSFPEPTIARLKDPEWDARIQDVDLAVGFRKGLAKGTSLQGAALDEAAELYAGPFAGKAGREAYLRAARALRTADLLDRTREIERIRVPTLVVWGGEDQFQPVEVGHRLAGALVDARLEVVTGAGHFLPEDAPEELVELLLPFLGGSTGGPPPAVAP
jgi:pimeloyl-ACP methyl ester carboxylesterase